MVLGYRRMINDYLVRWSPANGDKVAPQLTHYETNPFAIQNQASHLAFNLMLPEGTAAGNTQPAAHRPRRNHKAPWHSYGVCAEIWFDQ